MKIKILGLVFLSLCLGIVIASPAKHEGKRLIKTSKSDNGQWVDTAGLMALKKKGVGFIDITDRHLPASRTFQAENIPQIPSAVRYKSTVSDLLKCIDSKRQRSFIVSFSNYHTRLFFSQTGKDSSLWLISEIQASINSSNYQGKACAKIRKHIWPQPSIIAKLEGSDPVLKDEIVILGAHLDSINIMSDNDPAPGADDNGSGAVVILETLRILLEAGFIPKRTIEFHWYSAEEFGLRGSGEIAEEYEKNNVKVISMLNFDISGYFTNETIGIVNDEDDTNEQLNTFIRLIVDEYLLWKWKDKLCGYACSDHASFTSYGFPSAFPAEIEFIPEIHSAKDTIDKVNFEQVKEFTKIAIGYAIEVAEPKAL